MSYQDLPEHGSDGFWYRCDVRHYSVADEDGDHLHTSAQLGWRKFAVLKETPKGVWLREVFPNELNPDKHYGENPDRLVTGPWFIRGAGKKQYALPTKELAWEDCCQRKLRHIDGCKARLRSAENDLATLHMHMPRMAIPRSQDGMSVRG